MKISLENEPDQSQPSLDHWCPSHGDPAQSFPAHSVLVHEAPDHEVAHQQDPAQMLPFHVPPVHALPAALALTHVEACHGAPKTSFSPVRSVPLSPMWALRLST